MASDRNLLKNDNDGRVSLKADRGVKLEGTKISKYAAFVECFRRVVYAL